MRGRLTVSLALLALLAWPAAAVAREPMARLAVFPVENLSGTPVPVGAIRQFLVDRLVAAGAGVLGDGDLEAFMDRHRVRYTAGVNAAEAHLLREEMRVEGVVIASVAYSREASPPKVSLVLRLVSVKEDPVVVWADDAGLAGDDAPGWLELGVVTDYEVLLTRALEGLTKSLVTYVKTGEDRTHVKRAGKFKPRVAYQGVSLAPGRTYSVAVMPFFNRSDRRNAGETLALLFMRHLAAAPSFRVIDGGEVRQQLLAARVIMDGGVSISDADLVANVLEADFVLAGRVLYYRDYDGADSDPRVDFSTILIERKSRKVVWSSQSYRDGQDGVGAFGRGRSRTAHLMATQMVRLVTDMMAGGTR